MKEVDKWQNQHEIVRRKIAIKEQIRQWLNNHGKPHKNEERHWNPHVAFCYVEKCHTN